jgi:hypothetical protein
MIPYPRQKLPEISPIFKADTVRLHVLREKDKEIAPRSMPDGTMRSPFSRTAAGKLVRVEGRILPPGKGER